MDYTFFSMEEIDLMCCFDTCDRYTLIDQMEEIAPYIDDPELLALMEQTLDKIYVISDREYTELPLFPTWEDDANELDSL